MESGLDQISWTWSRLISLYESVASRIGTFDSRPANWWMNGTDPLLRGVLEDLARAFTGHSEKWTAVHQQLKWGVTTQGPIRSSGHARVWIRNRAAALEAGFMQSKDLPSSMTVTID
jgi:hypothetical protein